jgi:hypothetical protein
VYVYYSIAWDIAEWLMCNMTVLASFSLGHVDIHRLYRRTFNVDK